LFSSRRRVEDVSLGYTILRDAQGNEVIVVPNSVMVSNVVIRLAKTENPEPLP
jgi:small-conductance mechanosensitive channel